MRKIFCILALSLAAGGLASAQIQSPIRVNCGGTSYTDSKGQVWQADYGYNWGTGSSIKAVVSGTADQALYQNGRYNNNFSAGMVYSWAVPNGLYHVNLYLAETYAPTELKGARVFNVKMQGAAVFTNLDVFAEAGANAALVKSADITVSNGRVDIEFDNLVQTAKVNAIEIIQATLGPPMTLKFQYPDGTAVAGALTYSISSTLLTFQGTQPLVNGQAQCVLLSNPSALGISAQFQVTLSLKDTLGNVLWQMSLGMNPALVNLGTIQSSALNVVVQRI
ncbi:MAG TPA: malectin domain-containing carbohydrate-binding protein [Candidatus Acidoferrum sp.]|nr:malectin domain-containing carbohydrate-binding protein [Candidatus Acidoferrum sp.]